MDQALEKCYNKPAKGKAGIIGFTRRKEAVAQYDVIKHEMIQIFNYLQEFCNTNYESEYDLHHEFSSTITERDEKLVNQMTDYIVKKGNPFLLEKTKELKNIVTGKHFTEEEINFIFHCLSIGLHIYSVFVNKMFKGKTKNY